MLHHITSVEAPSGITLFESTVLANVRRSLSENETAIAEGGLTVHCEGLTVIDDSPGNRQSEISVWFWSGNDVEDVLEFFVERDGRQVATLGELDRWFRRELGLLLGRTRPR